MLIPLLQTGALGVIWLSWWRTWGRGMARTAVTGYTVRHKTAAAVGVIAWNASFLILLGWIWALSPWIAIPLLLLTGFVSLTVATWARQRD